MTEGNGGDGGRRGIARVHRDERGLIIGFFIRLALVMALLGLVIEEGGQMIVAQIHAEDIARSAAQAAADAYFLATSSGKGRAVALDAARQAAGQSVQADDPAAALQSVDVATDGRATTTVSTVAHTYVVKRVSFLRKLGVQHATDDEAHST